MQVQPVHPKGDQSWVFFGRTDAKAETPILWPPHVKSWLIGKDPDSMGDWGQEEKGTTEDEMAGWHHWLDGHKFEWTPGVGDGQGGLACFDSWGCKESDKTEWLNWTELTFLKKKKTWSEGRARGRHKSILLGKFLSQIEICHRDCFLRLLFFFFLFFKIFICFFGCVVSHLQHMEFLLDAACRLNRSKACGIFQDQG